MCLSNRAGTRNERPQLNICSINCDLLDLYLMCLSVLCVQIFTLRQNASDINQNNCKLKDLDRLEYIQNKSSINNRFIQALSYYKCSFLTPSYTDSADSIGPFIWNYIPRVDGLGFFTYVRLATDHKCSAVFTNTNTNDKNGLPLETKKKKIQVEFSGL